jgi:hypothetical protein
MIVFKNPSYFLLTLNIIAIEVVIDLRFGFFVIVMEIFEEGAIIEKKKE